MTILAYIHSSSFRLASGAGVADAFRKRLEEHFYNRRIDLEEDEEGFFWLSMEAQNVSDFFSDNVSSFLPKISDLVQDAFEITLREDTMADERDWIGYAGPTPEAIDAYKRSAAARQAIEVLRAAGVVDPADVAKALSMPAPQIFVVVEGGVVQHAVSSAEVGLTVIDYDTDGDDRDAEAEIPQDTGHGAPDRANLQRPGVNVSPARASELVAITRDFFERTRAARTQSQRG